jgi:membrane associated rhomboid family serine protease
MCERQGRRPVPSNTLPPFRLYTITIMLPLRDTIAARRLPIVLWALVFVNVLVFLREIDLSPVELRAFVFHYGMIPAQLSTWPGLAQHWATIITAMFVHGGFLHIAGNMWFLWIFGDNVEDRLGHLRFLLFYLLGGCAAAALQVLLAPSSTVPGIGASGAIAAVMGAYLVLYPRAGVVSLLIFPPLLFQLPAFMWIGIWFVEQWFNGIVTLHVAAQGGVAYWAHVGGFVFGLLVGLVLCCGPRRTFAYGYDRDGPWH